MKYINFYKNFSTYPLINLRDIQNFDSKFDNRRLYEWQNKGYIKKIINNFYVFSDKSFQDNEINFIANRLYQPSYLSLEYALNYYGLIPEIVFLRTSISSRKTKLIKTSIISNFKYQTIKPKLFFGYKLINQNNITFKIAETEKALLDLFYLRLDLKTEDDFYEMRFNKEEFKKNINTKKLFNYLNIFNSTSLNQRINKLINFLKKND